MNPRIPPARLAGLLLAAVVACSGARTATPAASDRHPPEAATGAGREPEPPPANLSASVESGCLTDCAGAATPGLVAALRERALTAKRCYDAALKRNHAIAGRIVVGLQITSEGAVCATRIVDRQIDDPELASCIREIFLGLSFPAPSGGCVDVALPLNLVPRTEADGGAGDGG